MTFRCFALFASCGLQIGFWLMRELPCLQVTSTSSSRAARSRPPGAHGPRGLALGARCLRPLAASVGVPMHSMLLLLRRMRRWLRRLRRLRTTMTKTRRKTTQMTRRRSRSYRRLPASSATSLGRPKAAFLGRTPTFASSLVMRFLRRTAGTLPNSSRVWRGK